MRLERRGSRVGVGAGNGGSGAGVGDTGSWAEAEDTGSEAKAEGTGSGAETEDTGSEAGDGSFGAGDEGLRPLGRFSVSRETALIPFRSSPYIGMYGKVSRSFFLSFFCPI
jgi:hypothetical protein